MQELALRVDNSVRSLGSSGPFNSNDGATMMKRATTVPYHWQASTSTNMADAGKWSHDSSRCEPSGSN